MLLLMINRYAPFGILGFNCLFWVKLRNPAGFLDLTPNPCSVRQRATLAGHVTKGHQILFFFFFLLISKVPILYLSSFKPTHTTQTWCEKQPVISEIFVSLCLSFLMAFQHGVGELPHSHWLQQTPTACLVSREELQPRPATHDFIRNVFSDQSSAWGLSPIQTPPCEKAQVSNRPSKRVIFT